MPPRLNPGWQMLDCTGLEGSIHYRRGQLVIHKGEECVSEVPLSRIAVVLVGSKVSISGAVLMKLREYDVCLQVCDWKGVVAAVLYPMSSHTRVAARHRAQAAMSLPRKKAAWSALVRAKILGQANVLSALGTSAKPLRELAKKVRSGDSDNCEALAARMYWGALMPRDSSRQPGAQTDPINACLDYGYTVLRSHAIRAVASAGLCGPLGVFHRSRGNPWCLADDLMEPFRPCIDFVVLKSAKDGTLDFDAMKPVLVDAASGSFNQDNPAAPAALVELAQQFGRYAEKEIDRLLVDSWSPVEVLSDEVAGE